MDGSVVKKLDLDKGISTIHVMPGLYCNFYCSHCVNESGPKQTLKVTDEEVQSIKESIQEYAPKRLQFTGGEPTFYSKEINSIVASHPSLDECEVHLTTNGWYGDSKEEIKNILSKFNRIDFLLLSYDKFHSSKFKEHRIANIKQYCESNGISFGVSMCITSPIEGIKANEILSKYEADVLLQKVDLSGRARKNNLAYKYPLFEEEVLEKKCPNLGTLSYLPNKGFTFCCGNLVFNSKDSSQYAHKSPEEHIESDFYKSIQGKTLGELAKEKGIDISNLKSEYSSPCSLCELIWEGEKHV